MERLFNHQTIDEFLLDITETAEYKSIKYLIFLIWMNYLHYMAISRIVKFEIPKYLENLIGIVIDKFNESGISTVDMLQYMLDNDINNWIHYYAYTFIIPVANEEYCTISDKEHLKKIQQMPVHFLCESGKGFFVKQENGDLALKKEMEVVIENPVLAEQMRDVIDYRTMDYYQRRYIAGKE